MAEWQNDDELFQLIEGELFVAVIGDVLDNLGFRHQFLPPSYPADSRAICKSWAERCRCSRLIIPEAPGKGKQSCRACHSDYYLERWTI